jgi:hypothetical protein
MSQNFFFILKVKTIYEIGNGSSFFFTFMPFGAAVRIDGAGVDQP